MDWLEQNNWAYLLIVLAIAIVLGGIAFLIHRLTNKNKKESKPSEDQIAEETMDRFLVDVDDENQKAEFDKYEENKNEKEDK